MSTDLIPTSNATAEIAEPDGNWTAQQKRAAEMADGLRSFARFIEENPQTVPYLDYALGCISAPLIPSDNPRTAVAQVAQAAARRGAKVQKDFSGQQAGVIVSFSPAVRVKVFADRADVCERVVVGTSEVTKEVPDPEALASVPTVTVTETVEQVEWRCYPLLADVPNGSPS